MVKRDVVIGFSTIYQGHNRRTWANYWSPLLSCSMCTITSIIAVVYPVITAAAPGEHFTFLYLTLF